MGLQDEIVNLLAFEQNLTAKQIFNKITKENNISYQAVHKKLSEMENQNILKKEEKNYSLNSNWVIQQKEFYEKLLKSNNKKTFNPNLEIQTLELDTLFEFFGGMLELFSSDILYTDCEHRFGGGLMRHMWWALSFGDTGLKKFKHMMGPKNSYVVVKKDTPVDRWLEAYYKKCGATGIVLGADYGFDEDIAIVGNYVIQVFYEDKTIKQIDKLYSEVKDISDAIEKGILEQLFSEKNKVKVIITKNKDLSEIYLKKLLSYFGNSARIIKNPEHTPISVKDIEEKFRNNSFSW